MMTEHIVCDGDLSLDLHDPGQTPGALLLGCRGEHLILAVAEDKIRVKMKYPQQQYPFQLVPIIVRFMSLYCTLLKLCNVL